MLEKVMKMIFLGGIFLILLGLVGTLATPYYNAGAVVGLIGVCMSMGVVGERLL